LRECFGESSNSLAPSQPLIFGNFLTTGRVSKELPGVTVLVTGGGIYRMPFGQEALGVGCLGSKVTERSAEHV